MQILRPVIAQCYRGGGSCHFSSSPTKNDLKNGPGAIVLSMSVYERAAETGEKVAPEVHINYFKPNKVIAVYFDEDGKRMN